jgi:hypothetical protein
MPEGPLSRRRWRGCLAAWFAALLAIAPVAGPSLPDPGAPPAVLQDHGLNDALQAAAEPAGLGILSRLSPTEPSFGPAPAKPPLHRPRVADGPVAAAAAQAPKAAPHVVLQRSAVGTARTPTGPPS